MIRALALALALAFLGCSSSESPNDDGGDGSSGSAGESGSGGESSGTGGSDAGPPPPGASRTSGLAPLYVFFDVTEGLSKQERIHGTFAWNFDTQGTDPDAPYPTASGFVVGHVYEEPGTYVTEVQIAVPGRDPETRSWTIEVGEFDGPVVYVAADGDDANEGTIDAPIQTIQEALGARATPGTRILFRNGDRFETSGAVDVEGEGPVLVGAYSDPGQPSDAKPELHNTDSDGTNYFFRITTNDWRFQDLLLTTGGHTTGDGGPQYPSMIDLLPGAAHTLFAGLEIREYGVTGISLAGDANAVYQTEIHRFGRTGIFSYGEGSNARHSVIGNVIHDSISDHPEHVVRIQQATHMFIGFNHFQSAHNKSNTQIRGNSTDIVIYKNVMDRLVGIQPKNDESEEYVSTVVFDSNLLIGRTNESAFNPEYPLAETGVLIAATDIAVRNNVIHGFNRQIRVASHVLVGTSQRIGIYNNTLVCTGATSQCLGIDVCDGCGDVSVVNNISLNTSTTSTSVDDFVAAASADALIEIDHNIVWGAAWDEGQACYSIGSESYSLEAWQEASGQDANSLQTDPLLINVALDEAATEDTSYSVDDLLTEDLFVPEANSPAYDGGAEVGVDVDLFSEVRDETPDVGAVEVQN